ncbi:MAG: PHP domain-containing protein [Gammaproteobacteria bacterium]
MNNNLIFDLHTHSCCSDGELTPAELVSAAKQVGVDVLALTDHDTTAGFTEASKQAKQMGLQLVAGVEISTLWKKHEIHIVGLNIDPDCQYLQQGLTEQANRRRQRAVAIAERLQDLGIEGAYASVYKQTAGDLITRPHFAKFLQEGGYVRDMAGAFRYYLARGKPAYVSVEWPDIAEAVEWIKSAGGQAVLAHPLRYKLTNTKLNLLVQEFKQAGGEGIEVVAGCCGLNEVKQAANLAEHFNMLASRGSDFHGKKITPAGLGCSHKLPAQCQPIWRDWHLLELSA